MAASRDSRIDHFILGHTPSTGQEALPLATTGTYSHNVVTKSAPPGITQPGSTLSS